jgi:ribosome modulation factor
MAKAWRHSGIHRAGYEAFKAGAKADDCPMTSGWARRDWAEGWARAQLEAMVPMGGPASVAGEGKSFELPRKAGV